MVKKNIYIYIKESVLEQSPQTDPHGTTVSTESLEQEELTGESCRLNEAGSKGISSPLQTVAALSL